MRLNEYKNISDDVMDVSKKIYQEILQQCETLKLYKSRFTNTVYNEGTITVNNITIDFLMYYLDTIGEYNRFMEMLGQDANSYTDYDNRYIKIVSGFIAGYPSPDFLGNIAHEVNHLFEYNNGREKRVDLYNAVKKMLNDNSYDKQCVARCLYYTFQHEIDAFVHQFYAFLCQENPRQMRFSDLLQYSEYKNAVMYYDYVKANQMNKEVIAAINDLGYSKRKFFKRVHFALKKLENKMHNAYVRYSHENPILSDWHIRQLLKQENLLQEDIKRFGEKIEWGTESIFEF